MKENPALLLGMTLAGLYFAWLWLSDYRAGKKTATPTAKALPGATGASLRACLLAAIGALAILAFETWGEIRLGVSDEQSDITLLFGLYSLTAAIVEEIIFRGYIVVTKRGSGWLVAGIVAASAVFALAHPFLWEWDGGLVVQFTAKGWFSTGIVFVASLWFYTVRFWPLNPSRSLLPCFAAHGAKNLGVIAVKAAQGFVTGVY